MKGIYKITNLINKKVYIGQSVCLTTRERRHFYSLNKGNHENSHLQRAYNKHGGENFSFEIIEKTDSLNERELFWINEFGGINSSLNYNLQDPLTHMYSDYIRVKVSKSMMGDKNPNYGNNWSEEMKLKASESRIGLTWEEKFGKEKSDLAKARLAASNKGRKVNDSTKELLRQANIGENNPAWGKGDRQRGDKNPAWGKESNKRKPILQYTKDGILVKEYEFIAQIVEDGFNPSNAMYCARGTKGYKSHKGFIWKFKDDY